MCFQYCDCRHRHNRNKSSHKMASKGKSADTLATRREVQLPKGDSADSEIQLSKKATRSQRTVQYETPSSERTYASSISSASGDDSETEASSSSESSEKTPSVKSKQQHVERAKFLQRMFADIEDGGCEESVSSG